MVPDEDGVVATKQPAPSTFAPIVGDIRTIPSTYLEWTSTLQALYAGAPVTTPGTPLNLCPPPSSSSSPSPCMWGNQTVIQGQPISYASLHSHGGLYTHPAMAMALNMASRETEAKPLEGSDQGSKKASNGSLGNSGIGDGNKAHSDSVNADPLGNAGFLTKVCGSGDKATSGSENVNPSHSCDESGGEEFSRNSREDEISPCDFSISETRKCDQMFPAPLKKAPDLPATNKGVDLWNHSQVNGGHNTVGILSEGQSVVNGLNKLLTENKIMHDEREQEKQKRKLSNRESARRSRERKQKECEDLSTQVAKLNTQNGDLRAEIDQLNTECKRLEAENTSIVEQLKQLYGPGVLAASEAEKRSMSAIRILGVECNGHGPETSNSVPVVYQNAITLLPSSGKAQ